MGWGIEWAHGSNRDAGVFQADEGGGEESLTGISLAISILAVLVAMVTVLGHRSHTQAVLVQSKEGDQWNQYDAKESRKDNLQLDLDMLQLQPKEDVYKRQLLGRLCLRCRAHAAGGAPGDREPARRTKATGRLPEPN